MKTFKDMITELKKIKKEELTRRRLYEEILSTIAEFEDVPLDDVNMEVLKRTLKEMGCRTFEEMEDTTGIIDYETISAGKEFVGETLVGQFLYSARTANFGRSYILDGGENSWLMQWLRKSNEISSYEEYSKISPYHKVAKAALMNWNGLTEEEADKTIRQSTFEEIEGQVYAKGSMDAAIQALGQKLGLTSTEMEKLASVVYQGINANNSATRNELHRRLSGDIVSTYMDTLFAVHDNWTEGNGKKFLAREKKHQHMPSELIGWKETKADLLFVKPIFEALGIYVTEHSLEEEYYNRVQKYFLKNNVEKTEDLVDLISQGENFYHSLAGQTDITNYLSDKNNVRETVIPQIEEKGIGKVEDVRKRIVENVSYTVTEWELEHLTAEELNTVFSIISKRRDRVLDEEKKGNKDYTADYIRLIKVQKAIELRKERQKNKNQQ